MEGEKFHWPLIKQHLIVQIDGVTPEKTKTAEVLKLHINQFALKMNFNVKEETSYTFTPQGASFGLVLAESHLFVHTWPEIGYMHIDICLCSRERNIQEIENILIKLFQPQQIRIDEIKIPYPNFNPFKQPAGWQIGG